MDVLFVPPLEEIYPPGFQTWVEVEQLGAILEGEHRPGHFRGVATVCLKLFNLVRPQRAYFGQKDAQQVAVINARARPRRRRGDPRRADRARSRRARALVAQRLPLARGARARRWRCRARSRRAPTARLLDGLEVDYFEVADFDAAACSPPPSASARTRLIDNVLLEGDPS